jgi:hypothetical protein
MTKKPAENGQLFRIGPLNLGVSHHTGSQGSTPKLTKTAKGKAMNKSGNLIGVRKQVTSASELRHWEKVHEASPTP